MSYAEIGELTLGQVRCLMSRGREPVERVTDPDDIRAHIRRVQHGEG